MPAGSDRLSDEAIAQAGRVDRRRRSLHPRSLVASGGAGRDFWSLRRLMPVEPPAAGDGLWPRGGID